MRIFEEVFLEWILEIFIEVIFLRDFCIILSYNFLIMMLVVSLPPCDFESLEAALLALEESFLVNFPETFFEISPEKITVFREDFAVRENVTFADYMAEGKILKKFLLENNLANEENYKWFFSLESAENLWKNANMNENFPSKMYTPKELDLFIAKVDKNDPKLVAVMKKLENLQKNNW